MAEIKKGDKSTSTKQDPFVEITFFFVSIFVGLFLLSSFINMFSANGIFSNGVEGLTPLGILQSHTRPIASLENPIGVKVVTLRETDVYNSPVERIIGSHDFYDKGKILQGYVMVDGQKYWYVDYEKGVDGWVNENDIEYLYTDLNVVERIYLWVWSILGIIKLLSFIISIIFIWWLVYLVRGLTKLRKANRALLYPVSQNDAVSILPTNPKWEKILNHIESLNENDWKLAIIEADIILNDIINNLSLPGDTMGEKMKAVEKSDFTTIDNAWEAHKIRNQIAHEGSNFILTQREARRVVELYKSVFEEFQVI